MSRLRRPTTQEITARISSRDETVTYPEMGATAWSDALLLESLPSAYNVDRHVFTLGTGHALFERAKESLFAWRHLEIPWLEFYGASNPPRPGETVATLLSVAGLWFLNPCRVIYTEASEDPCDFAAFAYGTLTGHVECGEERFQVSFDSTDETVRYRITAFSRPAALLSKLGYPIARSFQKRFAKSSAAALARAAV